MIDEHLAYITEYLPRYLSNDKQKSLFASLKSEFPFSKNPEKVYKELQDKSVFYQGDAIIDIPFSRLNVQEKKFDLKTLTGAIISNTCDIASTNKRNITPYVNLAAIHRIDEFSAYLKSTNISDLKITEFVENIRNNIVSTLFYLPEIKSNGTIIFHESFIRFDETTSLSIEFLNEGKFDKNYIRNNGDRVYSFSNYGFYLFLFKLSVHFCRIRESVFIDSC